MGHLAGVHSRFGQISDRCFIDNIYGSPVNNLGGVARFVFVDPDGRLGTVLTAANATDQGGFAPGGEKQPVPQSPKPDTALNGKVEKLQATVVPQEKQIKMLTSQLKAQPAQLPKVS